MSTVIFIAVILGIVLVVCGIIWFLDYITDPFRKNWQTKKSRIKDLEEQVADLQLKHARDNLVRNGWVEGASGLYSEGYRFTKLEDGTMFFKKIRSTDSKS